MRPLNPIAKMCTVVGRQNPKNIINHPLSSSCGKEKGMILVGVGSIPTPPPPKCPNKKNIIKNIYIHVCIFHSHTFLKKNIFLIWLGTYINLFKLTWAATLKYRSVYNCFGPCRSTAIPATVQITWARESLSV